MIHKPKHKQNQICVHTKKNIRINKQTHTLLYTCNKCIISIWKIIFIISYHNPSPHLNKPQPGPSPLPRGEGQKSR